MTIKFKCIDYENIFYFDSNNVMLYYKFGIFSYLFG